jgi:predicted transport protein/predicted GIY-YIG superfamily endonuclease
MQMKKAPTAVRASPSPAFPQGFGEGKKARGKKGEFMCRQITIEIIVDIENDIATSSRIEMDNVLLFKFPISSLQKLRRDIVRPGVYVLVGRNDREIYIGKSDNVHKRLNTHLNDWAKEFWLGTLVFLCKPAMVQYLEFRLLEIAKNAENVRIRNEQTPNPPSIERADKIQADKYLGNLLLLTNELGIKFFKNDNRTFVRPAHSPRQSNSSIKSLYDDVSKYIKSLGGNIFVKKRKVFRAFRKNENPNKSFINVQLQKETLVLLLELNPKTHNVKLEEGFTRDMSKIPKFAPGDLEVRIKNEEDFEKARPLIKRTYDKN